MLAVVLAEEDNFFRAISHRLRLRHYAVVRYRDPVKLSDNLQELRPELLVVRKEDYPLHWVVLAAQLRCSGEERCRLCLFVPREALVPPEVSVWPGMVSVLEEGEAAGTAAGTFSAYLASLGREGKTGDAAQRPPSSLLSAATT